MATEVQSRCRDRHVLFPPARPQRDGRTRLHPAAHVPADRGAPGRAGELPAEAHPEGCDHEGRCRSLEAGFRKELDNALTVVRAPAKSTQVTHSALSGLWSTFHSGSADVVDTTVPLPQVRELLLALNRLPEGSICIPSSPAASTGSARNRPPAPSRSTGRPGSCSRMPASPSAVPVCGSAARTPGGAPSATATRSFATRPPAPPGARSRTSQRNKLPSTCSIPALRDRRARLRIRLFARLSRRARALGGPIRRFCQRRADHHRQLHRFW